MSDQDPAPYLLTEERSRQIFDDQIVPTVLSGGRNQEHPRVILLCAQAGAGKSVLARDLRATFTRADRPVHVDVDLFRSFYPGYLALKQRLGQEAEDLVQADARRWLNSALEHLSTNRVNIIVEHGLRDRPVFDALVEQFDSAGTRGDYRISAALLATPAAQSRLGILERYQVAFEKTGIGRYVTEAEHEERYDHTGTVAEWLAADPRIADVAVYRRGSTTPIFDTLADPAAGGSPRQALEQERGRLWDVGESRDFVRRVHSLEARMEQRWSAPLEHARDAAHSLLHPEAEAPRHTRPAVTFGRYQIVSIAHLDTIRTILLDWPKVEIGILDLDRRPLTPPDIPAHLAEFYADCEANTTPAKNPMSADERSRFWEATLLAAGFDERVSVRIIGRPELAPDSFNEQYPPDRFDLVFPRPSGDGFDNVRNASFEEVLDREVHAVDPPLEYHTSDIRAMFRNDDPAWRHGLAPGALDAFIAADGPRRLLAPENDVARSSDRPRLRRPNAQDRPDPEIGR